MKQSISLLVLLCLVASVSSTDEGSQISVYESK